MPLTYCLLLSRCQALVKTPIVNLEQCSDRT